MSHLVFIASSGKGCDALAYARRAGHRTTLVWSRRYDFFVTGAQRELAHSLADRIVTVEDPNDPVATLAALAAAGIGAQDLDAVLTTVHFCVVGAARLAEACNARGPSSEAIMAARDKSRCRRILDERGIPSVGHGVAVNASDGLAVADALGYPVVIKPATGAGKLVTSLARSPQDVERHFAEAAARSETLDPALLAELDGRFLVEEVAVGPLYSVEVATDGRSSTPLAAVRRKVGRDNPLLELGSTMPTGLSPQVERELGDYLVQICAALGLNLGIFHAEAILTEDGFRLIEVNPRIGGGVVPDVIRAATDRNLFEILVDLYDGGAVPQQPLPARRGASNTFLGVPGRHTVRSDLPADWFEAFRPQLESGNTSIRAGMQLRPMENNFDRYGTVQVIADDFGRAEQKCAAIAAEMEAVVGVSFVPLTPSEQERYVPRTQAASGLTAPGAGP